MLCACTCTYTSAASVRVLVQASTSTKTRSCDVTEPSDCRAIPSRPAAIPSVVRRVCRSLVRVGVVGQTRRRNISWRQSTLLENNVRDGGGTGWDGAAINQMHLTLIPAGAAYVQRSNGARVNNAIRWLTWDQLWVRYDANVYDRRSVSTQRLYLPSSLMQTFYNESSIIDDLAPNPITATAQRGFLH